MGAFKNIDIMGQELQMHLSAMTVAKDDRGEYRYKFSEHQSVPAHSCEAAVLYLHRMTDSNRGTDKMGVSRYDADYTQIMAESIKRWGSLTEGGLRAIQRTKERDGKNGLLMKYRGQLQAVGFYMPALLAQRNTGL